MKNIENKEIVALLHKHGDMTARDLADLLEMTTHATTMRLHSMQRQGCTYQTATGTWRARTASEYIQFVQQKRMATA
jgi:predicted ArsR family transcriptional regulator